VRRAVPSQPLVVLAVCVPLRLTGRRGVGTWGSAGGDAPAAPGRTSSPHDNGLRRQGRISANRPRGGCPGRVLVHRCGPRPLQLVR